MLLVLSCTADDKSQTNVQSNTKPLILLLFKKIVYI